MRKILSLVLTLAMLFSLCSIPVFAESEVIAKIGTTEYTNFSNAMTAANATSGTVEVEIYGAVEFTNGMELNGNYTSITFIGEDSDAQITINQTAGGDYLEAHGKTVNFTDLKLAKANPAWSGNSGHMGQYFSVQGGTVTYTNCTFPNGACTNTGTATYAGCTFQNSSEYGLWVYDDANVTVNGGTIESKKGIKVYSEGEDSVTSTLLVENATFTENITSKPAVAIGYAESITLIDNTYNNTTGVLELDSGSDADCEGITFTAKDANGNDITSKLTAVDRSGNNAACGVFVTNSDGTTAIYTYVAEAAKVAEKGDTVVLLYDETETVELAEGVVLDKNGYTAENVTVVVPTPSGTLTYGYTKEVDGYVRVWGEVYNCNASESFLLKLYSGEELIAVTQLNDVGNIIDGDIPEVTWNFFYPESNDEYWTTTWEEGHPNSAAQPDKVVLYIDGTKVAENEVQMNAADNLNPVVWKELGGVTKVITGLEGAGTAESPYLINNLEELKWFRDDVNNGNRYNGEYIKLTSDIDLKDEEWTPIGDREKDQGSFLGTFDGDNHTISNLWISQYNKTGAGFFSKIGMQTEYVSGTVKNFTFNNVTIVSTKSYVGVIAQAPLGALIENVNITGKVNIQGYGYVGGIVGHGYPTINNSSVIAEGDITATYWGAGIIFGFAGDYGAKINNATVEGIGTGLTVHAEFGGAAAVTGSPYGAKINGATVSNVTVTSNSDYCMGYVTAGGTVENAAVTNVTATANGQPITPADIVAEVNGKLYFSLQAALDAAALGTGNVTVEILKDINLSGVDWNPVTVSAPGYPMVTVNGNNHTITGLNDMLFAGTWAGKSGLVINDLTIKDSNIEHDVNDKKENIGVGAFIGYPQASATITLNNCHLLNSIVNGGHWTGGLIGMAGGYNGSDGPVFMNLTITGCSVTGSNITGKGSVGGVIGHGSCAAWTNVVIEDTTVSGNTITSTGSSTVKAGSVMGTIGAAGQETTANGETKTGGAFVSAAVSNNTVTSNGTAITTIYGRQGTPTGALVLNGGTYDSYPIEETVSYASPAEGYIIEKNADGTYSVNPAQEEYVAKIGNTYFATFKDALNSVTNDQTIELLNVIGDEKATEIDYTKDIKFTITGDAPNYALPVVTFKNTTVTIEDAEILIPELDARQNATINVVDSIVHDAGGNSIVKSYYNGAINISGTSVVYTMQATTMGYITISDTAKLNATWQTNVYGNGLITVEDDATFATAALHLTAQDYNNRDNTDSERVGKPAAVVVDGATLTVGKVYSDSGADYSYNSSKGINIGTIAGKSAVLDAKNGAKVNIYMANGETANIGANGTVNLSDSTLNLICRDADGKVTLENNGTINLTEDAVLDADGSVKVFGTLKSTGDISGEINMADANANIEITGGTYTQDVSAWCPNGYICENNGDGTYSVNPAEEKTLFSIAGTSMTLGNDLSMNFYFEKANIAGEDYYVVITKTYADKEDVIVNIPYSEWIDNDASFWKVSFDGIAAKEMCDEIHIQVFSNDGTAVSEKATESIRNYSIRRLANTATSTEEKITLVDMLNYGAAAQIEFNYNTEDLADAKLTEEQKGLATDEVECAIITETVNEKAAGSTLVLVNNIVLRMWFKDIDTSMSAVISYTDHYGNKKEYRVEGTEFVESNGFYGVDVDTLVVADGYQPVSCTIYNSQGEAITGVTESVSSYVARAMNNGSAQYEPIIKFIASAKKFLHK